MAGVVTELRQQVLAGGQVRSGGGRGQGQQGPQALTPRGQKVSGDLVEEVVSGHHRLNEQGFEALQLFFECGKPQ